MSLTASYSVLTPMGSTLSYSITFKHTRTMHNRLDQLDLRVTGWMQQRGIDLLRISIGLIFFLFGAFKLINGMSPAEGLVPCR